MTGYKTTLLLLLTLWPCALSSQATNSTEIVDKQQLTTLEGDLAARQRDYDMALTEFNRLTQELETLRATHAELKKTDNADAIASSAKDLEKLEKRVTLAKERVDLAIEERKAVQTLLANLKSKLEASPAQTTKPTETTDKAKSATDPSAVPGVTSASTAEVPRSLSPRVAEAESEASKKAAAAQAAQRDVRELAERQRALQENLDIEKQRLQNAYKRYDNLSQTLQTLEDELYRELNAGKEFKALGDINGRRDATRDQLYAVSRELQDHTARIQTLQTELLGLQQEELAAANEAAQKAAAANQASLQRWLVVAKEYALVALPRAAVIIGLVLALRWVIRRASKRLVPVVARAGRGTDAERENHARTLVGVFSNAIETAIYVGTTLVVLQIFNVPVSTLLGGVAVVGLAVAFGAQNLIRDYFSGFMILLENQYKINDVVSINSNTGTVERITLRITVLRDFEGKLYFIPNGQITSVVNQTHEWSRVVLDIAVAYKERIEKVMSVLLELADAICREPGFQDAILREPELLGVEKLADSAVIVRLCFVTRPDKKMPIQREMLRRIKNRFEELGIEIPYPQQTVHLPSAIAAEKPPA